MQAQLRDSEEREGELGAQIAELRQQSSGSEQERQQELESLRAELAEYTSGMAQRDSELQVLPSFFHTPRFTKTGLCSGGVISSFLLLTVFSGASAAYSVSAVP